jgi:Tfp pilus assembly protein PilE
MKKNSLGLTFIEIILYVAIVSLLVTTLIPFAWNIIGSGEKSANQQEVFSQARFMSERLKYEIRNAVNINTGSSNFGSNLAVTPGNQLSLKETTANDPTIIDVSSGLLRIKQGAASAIALNSNDTKVTNLTFTNYTSSDNKTKQVGFTLTLSANYSSAGNRQEYQVTTTIESSAELRSN